MYLNCGNATFILILQTMAFHISELRNVKFYVPVEALNRSFWHHASGCLCFRKELVDGFWNKFISDFEHSYSYSINKDLVDRQYF